MTSFLCLIQSCVASRYTVVNIDFCPSIFIFRKPKSCSLIAIYFRHKTPCIMRKLTSVFASKREVFSRFSWWLDFSSKMVEFPLTVRQIWWSPKRVAIQTRLMNIHVSECKYYCLHFIPKFGDVCNHQNWRLHSTVYTLINVYPRLCNNHKFLFLQIFLCI